MPVTPIVGSTAMTGGMRWESDPVTLPQQNLPTQIGIRANMSAADLADPTLVVRWGIEWRRDDDVWQEHISQEFRGPATGKGGATATFRQLNVSCVGMEGKRVRGFWLASRNMTVTSFDLVTP